MEIKFYFAEKKERDRLNEAYGEEFDWALMSQCITSTYNCAIPNRRNYEQRIRLKIYDRSISDETSDLAGYFNYGHTLYLNIDLHNTFRDLSYTLFHEFYHWHQFWIDNRAASRMTNAYSSNIWDADDAENEAEEWALIGHFTFDTYINLTKCKKIHNDIKRLN